MCLYKKKTKKKCKNTPYYRVSHTNAEICPLEKYLCNVFGHVLLRIVSCSNKNILRILENKSLHATNRLDVHIICTALSVYVCIVMNICISYIYMYIHLRMDYLLIYDLINFLVGFLEIFRFFN